MTGAGRLLHHERQRDLLPLPRPAVEPLPRRGLSRAVRQRCLRRRQQDLRLEEVVLALNEVYGPSLPDRSSSSASSEVICGGPSFVAALRDIHSRLEEVYCSPLPPTEEAVLALLGTSLSYTGEEEASSQMASYGSAPVALPRDQGCPSNLVRGLGVHPRF